jgi:hypothetical protein
MTNRIVRFLSCIAVGVFASLPFATIPLSAAGAADECRISPKGAASAGQHWYYRIERGTKRHCWFLREEAETSARAAASASTRRAAPAATATSETTLTRADADAHAEMPSPQTSVEDDPQVAPRTPPVPFIDMRDAQQTLPNNGPLENPQSQVASRWPESTGMSSSAGELPAAPSFAVAAANANANASADADADLTPTAALAAPVAATESAEAPATGTLASLQMLLLVTLGALTLTGLTGSAVYVVARARQRPQPFAGATHRHEWPAESTDHVPPPWLEPLGIDPARDAEARSLEHLTRVSGIDQLLARLASQSQTGS